MTTAAGPNLISETVVHTQLENGCRICIRAVRPTDEPRMRRGIELLSGQSRYLRFFSVASAPPDRVIAKLVDVDGHRHLAWGAILTDDPGNLAIGAVHAIRESELSSTAEFAVGSVDSYHGLGLARMLTAVLLIHCRIEGIATMDVQILAENHAAANLVRSLGGQKTGAAQGVSDYTLNTETALHALQLETGIVGLRDIFSALRRFL